MAFADTIRTLPFTPRTPLASGFVPPMLRASFHILLLLSYHAEEKLEVTDEEALRELGHARDHWIAKATPPSISSGAAARALTIGTAIEEASAEWSQWTPEQRTTNLRDLSNRILQNAADLDRELVGIRDSDPGSIL